MFLLQTENISLLSKILNWLVRYDQLLFIRINTVWTNEIFDSFFPVWRESITWAPLYLFLLLFMIFNFGARSWPWVCMLLVTVTITDQLSSHLLKDLIGRTRPCGDPFFSHYVRLLMNRCPGSGSFTSSHATSHFGAAVFISMTLKNFLGNWRFLFYAWAFTISYGQVYVGVHYPLDVIGGGALGSLIGLATATFFYKTGLPYLEKTQRSAVKI